MATENILCWRCHMAIAPNTPHVASALRVAHRECYEAWVVSRYLKRPLRPQRPTPTS